MNLDDTSRWIIQGVAIAVAMILGLMWRELGGIKKEMKESNDSIKDLAIKQTKDDTRIALLEKIIDRLPCISNNLPSCKP
jgi:hypothetical protein